MAIKIDDAAIFSGPRGLVGFTRGPSYGCSVSARSHTGIDMLYCKQIQVVGLEQVSKKAAFFHACVLGLLVAE